MCFVYCYSNSQSQWTPLHHASSSGHVDVVKLLLTQGAEIDSKNEVSLVRSKCRSIVTSTEALPLKIDCNEIINHTHCSSIVVKQQCTSVLHICTFIMYIC